MDIIATKLSTMNKCASQHYANMHKNASMVSWANLLARPFMKMLGSKFVTKMAPELGPKLVAKAAPIAKVVGSGAVTNGLWATSSISRGLTSPRLMETSATPLTKAFNPI